MRRDVIALAAGVLFVIAFCALVFVTGPWLASVPHLPDTGASWYFWKLPNPTWLTRFTVWSLYLAHQFTLWGLIAWARKQNLKVSSGLHRVNFLALGLNALFVVLHWAQTNFTYDGLAQDVSIWSSLGSVAFLLIWVLLMENPRRGLFFGWKAPISNRVADFAKKTHGYVFAWAVIYTFWYHPTEATSGHLIGFFYTLLLMLQGSLFFTRIHTNKWWTLTLEMLVIAHGTLVALMQNQSFWTTFFFGFSGLFIITQMHGLGWSRLVRGLILAAYLGAVVFVYSNRGVAKVNEVFRIPLIDYVGVAVLALLLAGIVRVIGKRQEGTPT